MAGITAAEAFSRLEDINSQEGFKNLINSLSVDVGGKNSNAKTLFYSGKVDGVDTASIAAGLIDDPNIKLIDNTEADKFLASLYIDDIDDPDYANGQKLKIALNDLFGGDPFQREPQTGSNYYLNNANGGAWDTELRGQVLT